MAKNQLTHIKAHKLFTYMANRAENDSIPATAAAIAKEASLALDFDVKYSQVDRTARELGIALVRKNSGCFAQSNGQADLDNVAEVCHKLDRIERKLNEIMSYLNIQRVE